MRNRREFITNIGLASLLLGTGCSILVKPIVRQTSLYKKKVRAEPLEKRVNWTGDKERLHNGEAFIDVVYCKGTPYEIGYQHGLQLKEGVRENVHNVLEAGVELIREKVKIRTIARAAAYAFLDDAYKEMEPHIPNENREEMIGLAEGAGLPVKHIQWAHSVPELSETSCTGIAALGEATPTGKLYQVRVLDYIMKLRAQNHPALFVCRPREGIPYVNIGFAGLTGLISGMNAEGVVLCEGGYGSPQKDELPGVPKPHPPEIIQGIPMIFLMRKVLQYAGNAEQAEAIFKSADRTSYYAYLVGHGKAKQGEEKALGFVSTSRSFTTFKMNEQVEGVPFLKNMLYASAKSKLCHQLLDENNGKITPELLMNTIIPRVAMEKACVQAVVYEPERLQFWVANAKGMEPAYRQPYIYFNFEEALKKFPKFR